MKPFVRYTALALALVFLSGGCIACIDLIRKEVEVSDPLWRTAVGFLTTGAIFLALGLRGLRFRARSASSEELKVSSGTRK